MAAAGIGFAGLQLFPFAEVLDIVQADARRTGRFREGLFTGLWTANEKVGLAAGGLIQGAILSAAGFVESTSGGAAQDGAALAGIRIAFSAAPAIVLAASLYLLKRYRAVRGAA
jgi:Na+/melibiose symporter-like transporter